MKRGEMTGYEDLVKRISESYTAGQARAAKAVNISMVETYWSIGQYIVEFEQNGNIKAEYGKKLLENLSKDLFLLHGKGFSRSNLHYMRAFYNCYPICEKSSHKLGWSHYVELLKIDDPLERSFYEKQSIFRKLVDSGIKTTKEIFPFFKAGSFERQERYFEIIETRANYRASH
ncbi:MAG TPA: DUF1016 N-terminal domain-containing protein [Chitinophagaceae bacterium]|nr:DUF1016 N-terminal domain-containing protein [Chitinophagaceae bacterium]